MKDLRKIFLLLGLAVSMNLQAGPVEELLKNSGNASDYPGSNFLVVFDSTYSDMQETGLTYVNIHRLYKVFTQAGALQLSVIKFDYDPLSAYVDIKKVTVYRADGSVDQLDMSRVVDYPAPARMIYWGAREKMIEVGRLEPGDAVEVFLFRKGFTYALLQEGDDDKYIPPMKGHFYDIVPFYSDDPVREKVYQTSIPLTKHLQYEVYNGHLNSSAVIRNGKMIYSFTAKDIKPLKHEANMVDPGDVAPKLLLSTSPDWYAKAQWFYQVNEDFGSFEFTPEIKKKVDEILVGARTELDSITRLTHWAGDEIRYSGISMGCGEGYTLHKGEMTFLDRCGVCKDKAGMLVTLLRAAGFESYAAMTMAGSRIDYIPADQFNHSVTVVKMSDGKFHLLDPTWVPFVRELWSSAEQQQNYLMGLPEGSDLAITPVSPPQDHFIQIYGNSELSVDGTLTGEVTVRAEGQSDAAVRRMFTGWYKDSWEHGLEAELKRVHPEARLTGVDYGGDPYDYLAGPIKITLSYEIPNYAMVTGNEIIMKSFIAAGFMKRALAHLYLDTRLESRDYPFRDRCSRLVQLNESIKLPGKYDLKYQPVSDKFGDESASFEGHYDMSLTGETLRMLQVVVLGKRIYEPGEWPSVRKVVLAENRFIDEPVVLVPETE